MKEREVGGLRCSEVLERLSDYVDGELPAAEVAKVDAHLAGCPNCARFGATFARMVTSLRATQATPLPLAIVANLEAALHADDG